MKKVKKYIPNILTISRLIVTPLIVYLGIKNKIIPVIIIAIFIALTDFLDGKLARLWGVSSELGAKLDTVGDKALAIGLLIILITDNNMFFYVLVFEALISIFNLYVFIKERIVESLLIGKIKTWIIFITIILGLLNMILPILKIFVIFFGSITIILQILSLISYIVAYNNRKYNRRKTSMEQSGYYKIVEEILNNKEFLKRKEYEHHFNESVYDHVLRVSFDCYQIGKRFKLDYKALAIAGLLHDFYDKPWQDSFEKTKFLKKHGFVHAEEARVNAKKHFPHLVNKKIESMISTHMFPLNIRLPKYKESWILTLVDKVDSMEFLLHPYLLSKRVRIKLQEKANKQKTK